MSRLQKVFSGEQLSDNCEVMRINDNDNRHPDSGYRSGILDCGPGRPNRNPVHPANAF